MSSPTLQTLQDPILPLPWVCFRGGGFANPSPRPSMRALLDRGHPARVCAVPPSQAPPCSLLLSAVYPVWHCAHAPSQAPPHCNAHGGGWGGCRGGGGVQLAGGDAGHVQARLGGPHSGPRVRRRGDGVPAGVRLCRYRRKTGDLGYRGVRGAEGKDTGSLYTHTLRTIHTKPVT
jgi:hypothetical protein